MMNAVGPAARARCPVRVGAAAAAFGLVLLLALTRSGDPVSAGPRRGGTGMSREMVRIPATSFETVDHATRRFSVTVSVSEFRIGRTPVTQKQYAQIMGTNPSRYEGDDRPVENVSWWDAITYCNRRSEMESLAPCYDLKTGGCDFAKNGYRLPTSAEWTVASAGADRPADADGANIGLPGTRDVQTLMELVEEKGTTPVGSFAPNSHGIWDMAGNVWEWCYDYYYYNAMYVLPADARGDVALPTGEDPTGPLWGHLRVWAGQSGIRIESWTISTRFRR